MLRWLLDDHFVLLGYREYELAERAVRVRPGSGLGILDETTSAYARPVPLSRIEQQLRERLTDGHLLTVGRTNRASTVHRQIPMVDVSVKRVEHRRVTGEQRLLGLFAKRAHAEPASGIPVLRRKLRGILDAEDIVDHSHDERALRALFEALPKLELFAADPDALRRTLVALLEAQQRHDVRLLVSPARSPPPRRSGPSWSKPTPSRGSSSCWPTGSPGWWTRTAAATCARVTAGTSRRPSRGTGPSSRSSRSRSGSSGRRAGAARAARAERLVHAGADPELAGRVVGIGELTYVPDVAAVARRSSQPVRAVADVLLRLSEALPLERLHEQLQAIDPVGPWERRQHRGLADDLRELRRTAAARAVRDHPGLLGGETVQRYLGDRPGDRGRVDALVRQLDARPEEAGLAGVAVVVRALRELLDR